MLHSVVLHAQNRKLRNLYNGDWRPAELGSVFGVPSPPDKPSPSLKCLKCLVEMNRVC